MGLMTGIAIASVIAGTAISARGQIKAGKAAKAAGESAAKREEFNAQVAEQQAADALVRGADEESRFRTSVRGLLGTQRTGFAGGNVVVGVGSARDVTRDAARLGDLDALQIRANAKREAYGYRMEAEDRRMAADVARKGGNAGATAAKWGAATTVLGASSSLLMSKYGWDRNVSTTTAA